MKTTTTLFLLLSALAVFGQDKIYWTDRGGSTTIKTANIDGTNIENLIVPGAGLVEDIVFDTGNQKVYWCDWKRIRRANLDGTNIETLVTGLEEGSSIDLDLKNGKIYWADSKTRKIQRSNLDGTNVEDIVGGIYFLKKIRLNVEEGKLHWTVWMGGYAGIYKANLDGTEQQVITPTLWTFQPHGLDLDLINKKLYWADKRNGTISKANLDGSEITVLVEGLDDVVDVALDMKNGKMYWIQLKDEKIVRSNLDGSMIEEIITIDLSIPTGLNLLINPNTPIQTPPDAIVQIAPNPSDGIFLIQCDEKIQQIKVLGADGSFKFEKKIFYKTADINMSGYPAGAYILQIELEDKKLYENVVIY